MGKVVKKGDSKPFRRILRALDDQKKLTQWWESLEDKRGERATLRRCETPSDVLVQDAFHELCGLLPAIAKDDLLGLAAVAGLLAHVKENVESEFPRLLGRDQGGGRPVISKLRFQQILASEDIDELFSRLRRALQVVDKKANIVSLADGVLHWSREQMSIYDPIPSHRFKFVWSKNYFSEISQSK